MALQTTPPLRVGQVLEIGFPTFRPRITVRSERELTVEIVAGDKPERTIGERAVRMAFTALLLTIVLVFALLSLRLRAWLRRGDGMVDERDRAILSGSSGLQSGAVLTTLVVWVIGLTESFHAVGAVPLYYLNLVFWSCLVVNLLALPLGVLLGYRRS